jgi:diguanylate cyclase (GGDEF)-like protein/PAS domain S-box-containing protein
LPDDFTSLTDPVGGVLHDVLIDTAAVALWQWYPATAQLVWRAAMRRMLGMPSASDAEVDAALRGLLAPVLVSASCPSGAVELEHTLRLPHRAARRFRLHAQWAPSALGADPVLAGTITDITNAQVVAPPAELRDRYRLLVELSPDAIIVHCEGEVVFANRATVALVRAQSEEDLLGRPIFSFVAPESRAGLAARIAAMSESDTYSEPAEATLLRLDGGWVVVQSVSVRTRWEDKPAYQVIMRDLTAQKDAEASLRLQAQLIEHVSDAIIATDVSGCITSWNPAAAALYGWKATKVIGRAVSEVFDDAGSEIASRERGAPAEVTHRHRDGSALHVLLSIADIKDPTGAVNGTVMIASDIRPRRKAELVRQQADARYSAAVAALDEGLLIVGADGTVETANPAALELLQCASLVGENFSHAVALLDEDGNLLSPGQLGLVDTRYNGTAHPAFTAAVRRTGGGMGFLSVSIRALPTETGTAPFPVVMCLLDVTDRHAAAALLRYEARHDHMTGLANRNLVLETISELLHTPRTGIGVLFIDLDRFKMVNDSLGHDAGDTVLRTIARRLANDASSPVTVGRLAGDEFVLVVPDATEAEMQELAAGLLDKLCEPVRIAGRDIVVTCSIGIAVAPAAPRNGRRIGATDVLRNADVAMYYAKQHGRNRIATFDERFRRRAVDRLELEEDLRKGLERDELWASYQPIVVLDSLRTFGVEALARWIQPLRGEVAPTVFIPIAEETGLIAPLGQLMLKRAMAQLAIWRKHGSIPDLTMSVNLSPRQLADPYVAKRVSAVLQANGLPAEALNLEITESALMDDPELAARTLSRLRDLGVRISIDDFGTGYSSLSYLRRFPVTSVKIDRSFVERLGHTRDDDAIVAGIINLSRALGLKTCAEGIEHASQLRTLTELGCDFAQGFYFSKALTAEGLTPLLSTPRLASATAAVNASRH